MYAVRMARILATLLATCVFMLAASKPSAKPADLTLTALKGRKVRLRDYRGKVVVLNFWATWCMPCREEMPMLVETEKQYAARGVVFVAASLDDSKTRAKIPDFVKEFKVTFPVWTGASVLD